MSLFDDDERDNKRTIGIRDKQILYRKANKKCQNPTCNKDLEFDEMQVGHKKAWARGGRTTLKDSLCLCYRCNKLQGTDSWSVFLRKQGVQDEATVTGTKLESLSLSQLKALAKDKGIKVKGKEEDWGLGGTTRVPPTKKQYINKLKSVVSEEDTTRIKSEKPVKKKKKRRHDDSFW